MVGRVATALLVVTLLGVGWLGYRLFEAKIAAEIYQERLSELVVNYELLRRQYNEAVRKTAVTELLVRGGKIEVAIRTAEGVLRTIPTPFDPKRELYVDYVVMNDRLWIRRVFDEGTPPGEGVVIDPRLVHVDWDLNGAKHGKAAYRQLGEGRWVVSVTGDGSLGLARRDWHETIVLSGPPPVRDYAPIEEQVGEEITRLGPWAVARQVVTSLVP